MRLRNIMQFLQNNKEWIFSGIGVLVITTGITFFGKLFFAKKSDLQDRVVNKNIAGDVTQIINSNIAIKHNMFKELKNTDRDFPTNLSKIQSEDISVNISLRVNWKGVLLIKKLSIKGVPSFADVYLSIDGKNYIKRTPQNETNIFTFDELNRNKLFIKLKSSKNDQNAGPFIKTNFMVNSLKQLFKILVKNDSHNLLNCNLAHCEIKRNALCRSKAKFLKLSINKDVEDFIYDLKECKGAKDISVPISFSPPNDIFPLRPGEIIFATIEYADGDQIPFQFTVKDTRNRGDLKKGWRNLEPYNKNSPNEVPYAAVRIGVHTNDHGRFIILFGAGGGTKLKPASYYYDTDGSGFVEAKYPHLYGDYQFDIRYIPTNSQLSIKYEDVSGKKHGPYKYRFDIPSIIKESSIGLDPPRLKCSKKYYKERTEEKYWECKPFRYRWLETIMSWSSVKEIHYGSNNNELSFVKKVSLEQ